MGRKPTGVPRDPSEYNAYYYNKNRVKILDHRKERYHTDPTVRSKSIERCRQRHRAKRAQSFTSLIHGTSPVTLEVLAKIDPAGFYPIGVFAKALSRAPFTLYRWIREGYIPPPVGQRPHPGRPQFLFRGDQIRAVVEAYVATDFSNVVSIEDTDFVKKWKEKLGYA